jgi:hypothetical protein
MSEPKRYAIRGFSAALVEEENGVFVRYEDYARLKEEAERYRLASIRVDVGELHAQFNRALFDETVAENASLKAEVERLTKAGDAMASNLMNGGITVSGYALAEEWFKAKWFAAEEGKPQP